MLSQYIVKIIAYLYLFESKVNNKIQAIQIKYNKAVVSVIKILIILQRQNIILKQTFLQTSS